MNERPKITTYEAIRQLILDSVTAGTLTPDAAELQLTQLLNRRADDWWVVREKTRMLNGDYRKLPDSILDYHLSTGLCVGNSRDTPHFVHLSRTEDDDPSTVMVAYTPNADMGRADRQLRTRFTRFLMKFHGVNENEAAAINHRLRAVLELDKNKTEQIKNDIADEETLQAKLLREGVEMLTGEDIVEAYESCQGGITASCMTYHWDRWQYRDTQGEQVHPATVYARQPELALLVHRNDNGNIICRVLVHLPTKTYQRLYGDYHQTQHMLGLLTKHGFSQRTWNGVHLPIVEIAAGQPEFFPNDPGLVTYLMPWTDGDCIQARLDADNKRFVLWNSTELQRIPANVRATLTLVGTHNNPSHTVSIERQVPCAECATLVQGRRQLFTFQGRMLCRTCMLNHGAVMAYRPEDFWTNVNGLNLRANVLPQPMMAAETFELHIYNQAAPVRVINRALAIWHTRTREQHALRPPFDIIRTNTIVKMADGVYVAAHSKKAVDARGLLTTEYLFKKDAVLAEIPGQGRSWVTKEFADILRKQGFVEVHDTHYRSGNYKRERRMIPRDRAVRAFATPSQTRRIWIENHERYIAAKVGVGKETAVYARTKAVLEHQRYGANFNPLQPYRPDPTRWNFAKRRNEQEQAA